MSLAAAHPERQAIRTWLITAAAAAVLVSALCFVDSPARRWFLEQPVGRFFRQAGPSLHGASQETQSFQTLPADASVVAFGLVDVDGGEVRLSPQVPGKVAEVMATDGVRVRAGAPLLKLRSVVAENKVTQARESVRQSTLQLQIANRGPKLYIEQIKEQQQAVIGAQEFAEAVQEEIADLESLDEQTVVASRLQAARRKLNGAKAKVEAERRRLEQIKLGDPADKIAIAEADLAKAKSAVAEAEEFLNQHTLTAPENGTILRVMISNGQVLANPMQPAILFRPDRKLILRCEINQEFADRVKNGDLAEIRNEKADGAKWAGKVVRLSDWIAPRRSQLDEPFEKNDVRTLEAIVEFTGPHPAFRQGQRLRVVFRHE